MSISNSPAEVATHVTIHRLARRPFHSVWSALANVDELAPTLAVFSVMDEYIVDKNMFNIHPHCY